MVHDEELSPAGDFEPWEKACLLKKDCDISRVGWLEEAGEKVQNMAPDLASSRFWYFACD